VSLPVVLLLSGPNLALLGEREPEVYGSESLAEHVERAEKVAARLGAALEHVQSESEAGLIEAVHRARDRVAAIVVNAGALSHYGWSLHDALGAFSGPIIEVHLSNPLARERWRHASVIAPVADGYVAGMGGFGYELAVTAAARMLGLSGEDS
jgi:3-dehydroquinate dehydratase II